MVGTLLFIFFIVRLFSQLLIRSRQQGGTSFAMVTWTLAGILIAQLIALPDLSWPPLWALLILATGLLTSQTNPMSARTVHAGPLLGPSPANPRTCLDHASPMRIAIGTLGMKRKLHGVGCYIKNLVHSLAKIDAKNEYLIFGSSENVSHLAGLGGTILTLKRHPVTPLCG